MSDQQTEMKNNESNGPCSFCGGELVDAFVQHSYQWHGQIYVFEHVPAQVCRQCGEVYFEARVVMAMEQAVLSKAQPHHTMLVPVFAFNEIAA